MHRARWRQKPRGARQRPRRARRPREHGEQGAAEEERGAPRGRREDARERPELNSMSRYGGGADVYAPAPPGRGRGGRRSDRRPLPAARRLLRAARRRSRRARSRRRSRPAAAGRRAAERAPAELLPTRPSNPAQSGETAIDLDMALEGDSLLAGAGEAALEGPFELDAGRRAAQLRPGARRRASPASGSDGELVSDRRGRLRRLLRRELPGRRRARRRAGADCAPRRVAARPPSQALEWTSGSRIPSYAGAEEVAASRPRDRGNAGLARGRPGSARGRGALGAARLLRELASGAREGRRGLGRYDDRTIRRSARQFPFRSRPPAGRRGAIAAARSRSTWRSPTSAPRSRRAAAGRRLPADRAS